MSYNLYDPGIFSILGCFHVLAIINSAVMNIGVHMSLSDLVSSVCMPRSLSISEKRIIIFIFPEWVNKKWVDYFC